VVRGLADRVLPASEHGPGARALVREPAGDMFGLGSREAVVAAVRGRDRFAFGAPAPAGDLVRALEECGLSAIAVDDRVHVDAAADDQRVVVLAFAHGWGIADDVPAGAPSVLVALS
jgi:coenzyme F420-0:L-glutamate ligase/coenzyme F420-1:gamma-L-glutamate ligase